MSNRSRWSLTLGGSLIIIALFVLASIFLSVVFIGSPYVVRGSSMYPTLKDGNRVYVVPYRGGTTPDRGDVVVLKNVPGTNELLIKRIVALQGDRVMIGDSKLIVNDEFEYKNEERGPPQPEAIQIQQGYIFVMGDNEMHSFDSRTFGQIPSGDVVGKALFIWWPYSDWRKL